MRCIMMLLISFAMMRCLPQNISEATSLGVAVIISEMTSFAVGKHHAKRPHLSTGQMWPFCWYTGRDSNPQPSEPESDALSIEPPVHLNSDIIASFSGFVKGKKHFSFPSLRHKNKEDTAVSSLCVTERSSPWRPRTGAGRNHRARSGTGLRRYARRGPSYQRRGRRER